MKLKTKPGDFRVQELLDESYLEPRGAHRVYLVQKRKMTSFEAAEILSALAQVQTSDVSMAGLKDRQGVTTQYMSVPGGRRVELEQPELKIRPVGCASVPISAQHSRGNEFEIRVRDLSPKEQVALKRNRPIVAKLGVPNYFDEQRFGNLRHCQGWIAKDLMLGHPQRALQNLLCAASPHDAGKLGDFKAALRGAWGDWSECREISGRFGEHHSVFEHLRSNPEDFRGAFYHIRSRLRLIHLYAYQSHIWNRALALFLARISGDQGARIASSIEGLLVFPDRFLAEVAEWKSSLRLPGVGLEDVDNPAQRALFEEILADEGLTAEQFRIDGVSGFQLKGEDRRMFIKPEKLTVKADGRSEDRAAFMLTFELPRGAYATLVTRGLLAEPRKGPIDLKRLEYYRTRQPREHRVEGQEESRSKRWQGANVPPPTVSGESRPLPGGARGYQRGGGGRPTWNDRQGSADHGSRGGRPARKDRQDGGGQRESYGRRPDRGERPAWKDQKEGGQRESYGRKPDRGERPAWKDQKEGGQRESYGRRPESGQKFPWKSRHEGGSRDRDDRRPERGNKPSFGNRQEGGRRESHDRRPERQDTPAYGYQGGDQRKSYGHRPERGNKPAWKARPEGGQGESYGRNPERGAKSAWGQQQAGGNHDRRPERGTKPAWGQRQAGGNHDRRPESGTKPAWKSRQEGSHSDDRERKRGTRRDSPWKTPSSSGGQGSKWGQRGSKGESSASNEGAGPSPGAEPGEQ